MSSNERYLGETGKSLMYRVDKLREVCFSGITSTNEDCKGSKIHRRLCDRSKILNAYGQKVSIFCRWN